MVTCGPLNFAKVIIKIFSQNTSEYPTHKFHFRSCVLKNAVGTKNDLTGSGMLLFENNYILNID